jgi:uracil-DNA glycosylase family 4
MAELYKFGFANQPTSLRVNDGLRLRDAYMTAVVRCAPPKNKPTPKEIKTCKRYWSEELQLLPNIKVILALGRVAFDTYVRSLKEHGIDTKKYRFYHGAIYQPSNKHPALAASYHPSRQNTQTRKLTEEMFDSVMKKIKQAIGANVSTD